MTTCYQQTLPFKIIYIYIYIYIYSTKAWTAIAKLSIMWKSVLTDKMKHSFIQAAVVSILLYACTTWTLTKRLEKKLDSNYTRMLRAILNKSWRQHPTKHQLYGYLPSITKTIQVRRTRHAGHCWRSRDELISDVLLWTLTYGRGKNIIIIITIIYIDRWQYFSMIANVLGDRGSIPGRVIPKTFKMVLDTSLLNTQYYKVRIKSKVEQSRWKE